MDIHSDMKRKQERIIVKYKPHGTLVSVMRKQFDPQCHEKLGADLKPLKKEKVTTPSPKAIKPLEVNVVPPTATPDRLSTLKKIGWSKLNGKQRAEYKKLNA